MAPIIMMILPMMIDIRRPSLSATNGTKGKAAIDPREYNEDMSPKIVEFGLWKSDGQVFLSRMAYVRVD